MDCWPNGRKLFEACQQNCSDRPNEICTYCIELFQGYFDNAHQAMKGTISEKFLRSSVPGFPTSQFRAQLPQSLKSSENQDGAKV